jgi:hypothetical protein
MAPLGKQTDFRVSSRPIAQPVKPCGAFAVQFQPDKGHGLKGEAPRLNQTQRLRELGESCPQKQEAVFFRQRFHRQGAQLVNAHGGIVLFCCTLYCFLFISPRRVGVKDVVGFLLCFFDGWYSSCLSMCGKNGFRYAAGLEQTEAKQNGIAHTAPDCAGYVVGGSDLLDQHRINPDNHHD